MAQKESDIRHIGRQSWITGEWIGLCGHREPAERGEKPDWITRLFRTWCHGCEAAWDRGERP